MKKLLLLLLASMTAHAAELDLTIKGDLTGAYEVDPEDVFNPKTRTGDLWPSKNLFTEEYLNGFAKSNDIYTQMARQLSVDSVRGIPSIQPWDRIRLERLAMKKLGKYNASVVDPLMISSGDMETYWENLRSFKRWRLLPRFATGAARVPFDYKRTLKVGGKTIVVPSPIFICPMGGTSGCLGYTDIDIARGGKEANVPMTLSTSAAGGSLEDLSKAVGDFPHFFQLYVARDNEVNQSFLDRAAATGCALVMLTIDTQSDLYGHRATDLGATDLARASKGCPTEMYTKDPVLNRKMAAKVQAVADAEFINLPGGPYPVDALKTFNFMRDAAQGASSLLVWKSSTANDPFDISTIVKECHKRGLPILIKGITSLSDALKAIESGADGIVVSNHGGRRYAHTIGALEALAEIVPVVRAKKPDFAIWFDSGIRTGSDILTAYALGADYVGVGRPVAYAAILNGQKGVALALKQLVFELRQAALTSGLSSLNNVPADIIKRQTFVD